MIPGRSDARPGPGHELARRLATALTLLPVVGWLLWQGGMWSAALFALAAGLAAREYHRLTLGNALSGWIGTAGAAVLPLLPALAGSAAAEWALSVVATLSYTAWIEHLLRGPRGAAPARVGHVLAGALFPSLGLYALSVLRAGSDGLVWSAAVLLASWGNDTAAFFGGRAFGRHHLLPAVSPGKTWEGFLAGILGGLAGLFALRMLIPDGLGVRDCLALGLCAGIFGPLGDLSKSMLKRVYRVKDSGRLLPGHGGMLDRIDAVVFNAPLVLLYRLLTAA